MCAALLAAVRAALVARFPDATAGGAALTVTALDASNGAKISWHYIFRIAGHMWRDNTHCRAFMRRYVEQPARAAASPLMVQHCDSKTGATVAVPFADMAVYTRNRLMRLYRSAKARDLAAAAPRFLLVPGERSDAPPVRSTFDAALIARRPPVPATLLECVEAVVQTPLRTSPSTVGRRAALPSASDPVAAAAADAASCAADGADVYKTQWLDDTCVRVYLHSHRCAIKGGEHGNNNVYYDVNVHGLWLQQRCSSQGCRGRSAPRHTLSGETVAALRQAQGGGSDAAPRATVTMDALLGFLRA